MISQRLILRGGRRQHGLLYRFSFVASLQFRPCYRGQFLLQLRRDERCAATCKEDFICNNPFLQPAMQCNSELRVARNGELSNCNLRCCKLQGRLHVTSCKEDFMYNNPFLQSAMQQCIASCKERRTIQLEPTMLQVARETSCCKLQGRLHVQQPIFSTYNATMH